MKVQIEELDSQAFGRNVLQIIDPEVDGGFPLFERQYLAEHNPVYVYARIPSERLDLIHFFEAQGFRFMEFQLRMSKRLPGRKFDTAMFDSVLGMEVLGPSGDIEPILRLADDIFDQDRIFLDPLLDSEIARKRYRLYITKSWLAEDEEVLRFFDKRNGRLVSFHTHKYIDGQLVLTFLGGHAREYQGSGIGLGCAFNYFNHWIGKGCRRVRTHVSMAHGRALETEYKGHDYKAEQTFALLRKIY